MIRDSILHIRRRVLVLTYNKENLLKNYQALHKEQLSLYELLKDNKQYNRLEGIKPTVFGHLIMEGNSSDMSHKEQFYKNIRNDILMAIDIVLLEG